MTGTNYILHSPLYLYWRGKYEAGEITMTYNEWETSIVNIPSKNKRLEKKTLNCRRSVIRTDAMRQRLKKKLEERKKELDSS